MVKNSYLIFYIEKGKGNLKENIKVIEKIME
jgi:hypothetical protein